MSSDWNGPGDSWQDTPNANWTQSPDLGPPQHEEEDYPLHAQQEQYAAYASEADNFLDASFLPEQDVPPNNQETDEGESEDAAGINSIATPDSWRKQLWQYVTLIVFPLLFFGVASLLVLPSIATAHAYLPPVAFWFIVVVFLGIAIGQGVAVHFSASHHNMWILGTIGGFILFLLFSVFALTGPLPATLLLLAILGGGIYLARRCIHSVPEGFVDIVYVAGEYERNLYTGPNLIWPWEQIAHQVNIEEINWRCNPQIVQLSSEDYVTLRADISYQILPKDAGLAVTQISNWEESLRNLLETTVQTISTNFESGDFLPWLQSRQAYKDQTVQPNAHNAQLPDEDAGAFSGSLARRDHINRQISERVHNRAKKWGVKVNWVDIRDIKLVPDTLVGTIIPDHTKTANNDEAEKELVGVTNHKQPNVAQGADTHGNSGSSHIHDETTEVLQSGSLPTSDLPLSPQKIYGEEQLKKAYAAVQNGQIKEPLTIRQIARSFEAVAKDPEASKKVSFDANQAAKNLQAQAELYEKSR